MTDRPSKKPGLAADAEALVEAAVLAESAAENRLAENLDALKASLDASINEAVRTTKSSNESIDAKIDALSQQVATMKGDISTTKSDTTSAMEKRATALEDKLDAGRAETIVKLTDREGKLEAATEQVASLQYVNVELRNALEADRASSASKLGEVEGRLEEAAKSNALLANQVVALQNDGRDSSTLLAEKEAALSDARSTISSLRETNSRLPEQVAELTITISCLREFISQLSEQVAELRPPRVLTITFAGGSCFYGNIFKVQAVQDLLITGFSIHTQVTFPGTVEVWERTGDYSGFENDQACWTLAQRTAVAGLGKGSRTELANLPAPVSIAASATHSFHICSPALLTVRRYSPLAVARLVKSQKVPYSI